MIADFKSMPISTGRGIQLYIGDKHVKTISSKYIGVWNTDFIEDLTKRRLNDSESQKLNRFYKEKKAAAKKVKRELQEKGAIKGFLSSLAKTEPYVYELVKDAKPIETRPTQNYFSENWKELVFDNKVRVKIPHTLFNKLDSLRTNKIKYVN